MKRAFSILATLALILTLMPLMAIPASANTIVVDLNNGNATGTGVTHTATTITIAASAGDIINISGNSGGKQVVVTGATTINLAAGTVINVTAATNTQTASALRVPGNSTVNGGGSNVHLTGGSSAAFNGGHGIFVTSNGTLTLTGLFGNITGGNTTVAINGFGGDGVCSQWTGNVLIEANISNIKGGDGTTAGGSGVRSDPMNINSDIIISREIGSITAGTKTTSGDSTVTSTANGILADRGNVVISGTVGSISGGTIQDSGEYTHASSGNGIRASGTGVGNITFINTANIGTITAGSGGVAVRAGSGTVTNNIVRSLTWSLNRTGTPLAGGAVNWGTAQWVKIEMPTYNVTNSVTNATITNTGTNAATHGTEWTGTLSVSGSYTRPTLITITVGGSNFTNFTYDSSTGAISIPAINVTGNIVISGSAVCSHDNRTLANCTVCANTACNQTGLTANCGGVCDTCFAPPVKSVSVGTQSGTLTEGKAGTVTFPVTTANIADGDYDVTVANLPSGVEVQGQVTINNNSGTLTLAGDTTTTQGMRNNLTLTIDGATSAAFTLNIKIDTPHTGLSDLTVNHVIVIVFGLMSAGAFGYVIHSKRRRNG